MNSSEIAASREATDRHRRQADWALTPEQRMQKFYRLQASVMRTLRSNPEAYRAYRERSHRKRAQHRVKALEAELKQ